MKKIIEIPSLRHLDEAAASFLRLSSNHRVIAFYGSMGAGKTTFIKALCKQLGVQENTNSPSFAIIYEYHTMHGEPVYHFDFYRLNKPDEAYDLGYEEYFYSGHYCLIEWPEKIEVLLPPGTLKVTISVEEEKRMLCLEFPS